MNTGVWWRAFHWEVWKRRRFCCDYWCASDHGKIQVVVPVPPVPALGRLKFMNRKNKRKSDHCDTRLGCEGQFLDSCVRAVTKMMLPKCNQHWAFSFQLFILQFIPIMALWSSVETKPKVDTQGNPGCVHLKSREWYDKKWYQCWIKQD